jgi:hypothetical protein
MPFRRLKIEPLLLFVRGRVFSVEECRNVMDASEERRRTCLANSAAGEGGRRSSSDWDWGDTTKDSAEPNSTGDCSPSKGCGPPASGTFWSYGALRVRR